MLELFKLAIEKTRFEEDKRQHFSVCFVLIVFSLPFVGLWASVVLTQGIGFAKEIWDHYYGSGFCWFDIFANTMGMLSGLLAYGLLQYI